MATCDCGHDLDVHELDARLRDENGETMFDWRMGCTAPVIPDGVSGWDAIRYHLSNPCPCPDFQGSYV